MDYIVDAQGFKRPFNEFVFKELAMLPLQEDAQSLVFLFQPPCSWSSLLARYRSENQWLIYNYHGINWTAGDIPYKEVRTILREILANARTIYVEVCNVENYVKFFYLDRQRHNLAQATLFI